jgi:hypothetical protein
VASSFEYYNESSDSIKGAEFLANLRGYKFSLRITVHHGVSLFRVFGVPNNQALTRTAVV